MGWVIGWLVAPHCFWILGNQNYWLRIIDWLWIFPCIKFSWHCCSMWEKPGWVWRFHCEGLFSFNVKGFCCSYVIWSHRLTEERTSFCTGFISGKLCRLVCFRLALLHSFSHFFFLYWLPSSFLCTVFDSIFFYQNDIHKFTSNIYDIKTIKNERDIKPYNKHNCAVIAYHQH